MERTFVEIGAKRQSPTAEEWFRDCHVFEIPYIEIKKRKKYADLHWDCISIDPAFDGAVTDNEKLDSYIDGVFFAVAGEVSTLEQSGLAGWFRDIPVENIEQAARALYVGIERELWRMKEVRNA